MTHLTPPGLNPCLELKKWDFTGIMWIQHPVWTGWSSGRNALPAKNSVRHRPRAQRRGRRKLPKWHKVIQYVVWVQQAANSHNPALLMPFFFSLFLLSSGWDVEEPSQDGINPDVIISLTAPKKCAMSFSGKHFLAGRFLPYDIQRKYELNLPDFPGTDCLIEL